MIDRMTKYSFILLSGDEEKFLSGLQGLGVVDIVRSAVPVDDRTSALFASVKEKSDEIAVIESGTDGLLADLDRRIAEASKAVDEVKVWGSWDREKLRELGLTLHFYKVNAKAYDPAWETSWAIQKVASDVKSVWFAVVGDNEGFPAKELPEPSSDLAGAESALAALKEEREAHAATLQERKKELPALQEALASTRGELSRALASAAGEKAAEDTLTVFEGFAPDDCVQAVDAALPGMPVFAMKAGAEAADQPPIKLRNNRFVKMFEILTDMYGRPAYDGFDPTPFIAIFFMLFFAFCMGDAGYGLILVALGLGMKKALGKLSPLVVTLGAATTVIGFLFHTFFSMDIAEWQVFAPIKGIFLPSKIVGYDGTMVLSLIVGIVHLCIAMTVKTVMATKQNGFLGSLGVWGWTLLIVGGVITGTFALLGVIDKEVTKIVVIALGVISAIGIFLLNDIRRNPLLNIGSGLWETYNTVTGLLGDVLSYLRLYALGLAGSMLGKAFNDIGTMVLGDGSSIPMWIPFILIVIVGHTLNLAMAVLGAFVHPLRLNFLEFFKNSGYEATGRAYDPLKK